jgi:diguanylate cyclase (GGDEF)-like protein
MPPRMAGDSAGPVPPRLRVRRVGNDASSALLAAVGAVATLVEEGEDLRVAFGDATDAANTPLLRVGDRREEPSCVGRVPAADPVALQTALRRLSFLAGRPPQLRSALDRAGEALVLLDQAGRVLRVTLPASRMLAEHAPHGVVVSLGTPIVEALPAVRELLAAPTGEPVRSIVELPRRGSGRLWIELSLSPTPLPDGSVGRSLQLRDVDARTRAERQAMRESTHDALTGLPNRSWFVDRLAESLAGTNGEVAVILLDIDRFKVVNDALGPSSGDSLLVAFADRLLSTLRPGQHVARLGADEFAVLLPGGGTEGAVAHAEELRMAAREPFDTWGQHVFVSVSAGVAVTTRGPATAHGLLRDANLALNEAKGAGGNRSAVWDAERHAMARTRVQLLADLRGAVARRDFHLQYQPLVDLRSGGIVGFEALLRWRHPARGNVPPGDFIPLAEDTGLIVPLSRLVLEMACRQMRAWLDTPALAERLAHAKVAVNASARHFALPGFIEDVCSALEAAGLPPQYLEIEITESAAMRDAERAAHVVQRLRDAGVHVSIDDFGTGYSSLAYLHKLPVDALKVDRSLVHADAEREWAVVRSVLGLARQFGLEVVAEGVETPQQLARLRELGCDFGQGWLFAAAMPPQEAAALLERGLQVPALG